MKKTSNYFLKLIFSGVLSIALIGIGQVSAQKYDKAEKKDPKMMPDKAMIDNTINKWPDNSKKAARDMIDKYGNPNECTPSMVIWYDNGPWKRTIVYNEEIKHDFPMPHKDVMEQFIDFKVPTDKFDDLAMYDGSVIARRTKGELSAMCDKEPMNFLAMNLTNDIILGKRTIEQAREFYAQTAAAFMKGEKVDYTQKLMFTPMKDSGDSDYIMVKEAIKGVTGGTE